MIDTVLVLLAPLIVVDVVAMLGWTRDTRNPE